ncbi:MAG: BNR repeat-containing protein [Bythopirellula sp.]|nr:BNR repeat-containing protein [Bythopirellula sp.]
MLRCLQILCVALLPLAPPLVAATYDIVSETAIDTVPAGFPVGFSLLTHNGKHYAAYYNADHVMTLAECAVGGSEWRKKYLPTKIGWDSHNYVTMAMDKAGHLHVAGNMHNVPLVYFRARKPHDNQSLTRSVMVGRNESRCTYPVFFTDADGELLFLYRDGGSGQGSSIVNRYDVATQTWTRFLDEPLFDGEGERNSYPLGPIKGPDGLFHLVWVWRDTPDCATNHHLSYARSRDLKHWETAAGEPLELPLRLGQRETWVDPIPSGGGIINGCQQLTFDDDLRPIISYHKSDDAGNMQVYLARFEQDAWQPHPVTTWDKPVHFEGFGSMPFIGIKISSLRPLGAKHWILDYRHRDYGRGSIVVDKEFLQPTTDHPQIESQYPQELLDSDSDWPGIEVRLAQDETVVPNTDKKYVLRWETLGTNHDRPRELPLPPASRLQLIELERASSSP